MAWRTTSSASCSRSSGRVPQPRGWHGSASSSGLVEARAARDALGALLDRLDGPEAQELIELATRSADWPLVTRAVRDVARFEVGRRHLDVDVLAVVRAATETGGVRARARAVVILAEAGERRPEVFVPFTGPHHPVRIREAAYLVLDKLGAYFDDEALVALLQERQPPDGTGREPAPPLARHVPTGPRPRPRARQ